MIDAFHLPALAHPSTTAWSYGRGASGFELRVPRLTPALIARQANALREARARVLAKKPVAEIVRTIDAVAARLLDPADALRATAEHALPHVTGYSAPMIRHVLDRMAADWRAPALEALLRAEFRDTGVLDEFRPRADAPGETRAYGPELITQVFSGNVPGVAVTALVRSLLVKSASLGKTAVGEPILPVLFARGIAEADPALGACLAVAYWPGGDVQLERAALGAADAVVAYGGSAALAALRAHTPPETPFHGYGSRFSFAVVARESLTAEAAAHAAAACARDAATFDQQGCVSAHLVYVEMGGETPPRAWAALLADAMRALEVELPRGAVSTREASAIRQLRAEAEFSHLAGSGAALLASGEGTAWTVIYDPEPAFAASCLNRVVRVKPVHSLGDVPPLVEPYASLLQSVGVAAPPRRTRTLAEALGRLGASRVAPLGTMAWPPAQWHHDGHPPLRRLVRWCDLEA